MIRAFRIFLAGLWFPLYFIAVAVAIAQTVPPAVQSPPDQKPQPLPTPDSLAGAVGGAWNSTTLQVQLALQSYTRAYTELEQKTVILQKLEQEQKNLDAYLKACGDKPGCTVPITAASASNGSTSAPAPSILPGVGEKK